MYVNGHFGVFIEFICKRWRADNSSSLQSPRNSDSVSVTTPGIIRRIGITAWCALVAFSPRNSLITAWLKMICIIATRPGTFYAVKDSFRFWRHGCWVHSRLDGFVRCFNCKIFFRNPGRVRFGYWRLFNHRSRIGILVIRFHIFQSFFGQRGGFWWGIFFLVLLRWIVWKEGLIITQSLVIVSEVHFKAFFWRNSRGRQIPGDQEKQNQHDSANQQGVKSGLPVFTYVKLMFCFDIIHF